MYYPYLRARQFELIALRELAAEKALKNIMPVIEPVKESINNLNLANRFFFNFNIKLFLIVNPIVGDKPGDNDYFLKYIEKLENSQYLPAFHFHDNSSYIINKIDKYKLDNCMLVCMDDFSNEDELKKISQHSNISHIMLLEPHTYRSLDRFIKTLNKNFIRLDDPFEKQQRNADFLDISAHKFTEENLYFNDEKYQGFADFTVLPKEFIDGGSTPRAVVIHLTYLNEEKENQIWIRHFTSDTNDSISNVQGKFAEATKKTLSFCDDLQLDNSAISELRNYFKMGKYPGLGTVKKISIKNHLLIINNFLD